MVAIAVELHLVEILFCCATDYLAASGYLCEKQHARIRALASNVYILPRATGMSSDCILASVSLTNNGYPTTHSWYGCGNERLQVEHIPSWYEQQRFAGMLFKAWHNMQCTTLGAAASYASMMPYMLYESNAYARPQLPHYYTCIPSAV